MYPSEAVLGERPTPSALNNDNQPKRDNPASVNVKSSKDVHPIQNARMKSDGPSVEESKMPAFSDKSNRLESNELLAEKTKFKTGDTTACDTYEMYNQPSTVMDNKCVSSDDELDVSGKSSRSDSNLSFSRRGVSLSSSKSASSNVIDLTQDDDSDAGVNEVILASDDSYSESISNSSFVNDSMDVVLESSYEEILPTNKDLQPINKALQSVNVSICCVSL